MPITRSFGSRASVATASAAAVATAAGYNLRSNRPSAGHFAGMDVEPELTQADYAAAAALVAMRNGATAPAAPIGTRRSSRLASRA
jgi:hypothetical protein